MRTSNWVTCGELLVANAEKLADDLTFLQNISWPTLTLQLPSSHLGFTKLLFGEDCSLSSQNRSNKRSWRSKSLCASVKFEQSTNIEIWNGGKVHFGVQLVHWNYQDGQIDRKKKLLQLHQEIQPYNEAFWVKVWCRNEPSTNDLVKNLVPVKNLNFRFQTEPDATQTTVLSQPLQRPRRKGCL